VNERSALVRTWLRPRWIVGTIICLAIVILFVNLGFWQLRRLDERRTRNDLVESRMDQPAVPIDELLQTTDDDDARFRRVTVDGTWLPDSTVLVRSRALHGRPGYHVLGTLVLDDGSGVIVNRGFVSYGNGDEDAIRRTVEPEVPTATIQGIVRPTETRGRIGPRDRDEERLSVVNRVDVLRLQQQTDLPLAPVFVQQVEPVPRPGQPPEILDIPDVGNDGPHLSYAMQWFLFATIGVIGWPLVVRRASRDRDDPPDDGADPGDPGDDESETHSLRASR
jgi:surfeit locus 1 family protein